MKWISAILGFMIGIALVGGAILLLRPRLVSQGPSSISLSQVDNDTRGMAPRPDSPLTVEKSRSETLKAEIDKKRIPYFHFLHNEFADTIERAAVLENVDTLDLVISKPDPELIKMLVQRAVQSSRDYGFERARFYVKNPVGSIEPFKVVAETAWDGDRWNTFFK